ncbi:MAG TPA: AmmeMemoRadiSam system protein A [Vicinamibacteria bacterium]|nr:AmmeMemoRadiSam system protein A [Vicinamibacteria bacterium]
MILDPEEGLKLVALARAQLLAHYGIGPFANETQVRAPGPVGGLFATLERDGELRGCIGFLRSDEALSVLTRRAVVAAATEDPRFERMNKQELALVRITITVLTPPVRLCRPDEIEIGRDGLIVERDSARGLLLPRVAVERNWDRARFLDETCIKAGLPAASWGDDRTRVMRFQAVSFTEVAE